MEETDLLVRLEQRSDGPLHVSRGPYFHYRYAYARSADSGEADEPGQDYLVYRDLGQSFIFAACDGVGSSFFGDVSARFLGDELTRWLKENEGALTNASVLRTALTYHLSTELPPTATRLIDAHQFSVEIDMLREHLENLRGKGSETMFVCGRLDQPTAELPDGRVALAWLGDMRLVLLRAQGRVALGGFATEQRWSTKRGPVGGNINTYVGPLSNADNPVTSLVSYSDGFDILDDHVESELDDARLQALVNSTRRRSGSDDVSFLEVRTKPVAELGLPTEQGVVASSASSPMAVLENPVARVAMPPVDHAKLPGATTRWQPVIIVAVVSLLLGLFGGWALFGGDDNGAGAQGLSEATPTAASPSAALAATPTLAVPSATLPPTATVTPSPTTTSTATSTTTPTATSTATVLPTPIPSPLPDNDGDSLVDDEDLCPSIDGALFIEQGGRGCDRRDFDNDLLADIDDLCPTENGLVYLGLGGRGCQTADLDRDGINDQSDQCPHDAAGPTPNPAQAGCPIQPGE